MKKLHACLILLTTTTLGSAFSYAATAAETEKVYYNSPSGYISYIPTTPAPLQPPAISAPVEIAPPAPRVSGDFESMLVQVYLQDPRLQAERETLRILDERVAQAQAGFRPTLSANLAYGKQRSSVDGGNWENGQATAGTLSAALPLYDGHAARAETDSAKQRMMAGRASLLSTEQSVLYAAISAWLDVCEKEQMLSFSQANLERIRYYGNSTQQRYDAGDGTKTDIALNEIRIAEAEAQYTLAEAARDDARATYVREIGLTPGQPIFPSMPMNLPNNPDEASRLAATNPELEEAMRIQEASKHDIESARSRLHPKLSLRGNMSVERSSTLNLDRLRNDSLTLNLSIPLYQGGAEYSRVREARIANEKAREDVANIGRIAESQAARSWSAFRASEKVIWSADRAIEAANRALGGIEEEQRQGTRTLTEVLDSQAELVDAQIRKVQAEKNARLQAYQLLAATGQLTAKSLNLNVPQYDPEIHYQDVNGRWAGLSTKAGSPHAPESFR